MKGKVHQYCLLLLIVTVITRKTTVGSSKDLLTNESFQNTYTVFRRKKMLNYRMKTRLSLWI